MKNSTTCTPEVPCHQFRHCDYCARLRQHKIAELANTRCRSNNPTYAVITGLSPLSAISARKFHAGTGGLWTIEAGTKMGGLHANLILDSSEQVEASAIASALAMPGHAVWAQAIPRRDLRNVAAYISKRASVPRRNEYDGRVYGTWGTWRGAAQVAREQIMAPVVAAAAHQQQLQQLGLIDATQAASLQSTLNEAGNQPRTREEYKAIACRYLAGLRAIVDK